MKVTFKSTESCLMSEKFFLPGIPVLNCLASL